MHPSSQLSSGRSACCSSLCPTHWIERILPLLPFNRRRQDSCTPTSMPGPLNRTAISSSHNWITWRMSSGILETVFRYRPTSVYDWSWILQYPSYHNLECLLGSYFPKYRECIFPWLFLFSQAQFSHRNICFLFPSHPFRASIEHRVRHYSCTYKVIMLQQCHACNIKVCFDGMSRQHLNTFYFAVTSNVHCFFLSIENEILTEKTELPEIELESVYIWYRIQSPSYPYQQKRSGTAAIPSVPAEIPKSHTCCLRLSGTSVPTFDASFIFWNCKASRTQRSMLFSLPNECFYTNSIWLDFD